MAWATRTIYTSKCVQMDPKQLSKMSKFYSLCNKFVMQKIVGVDTTLLDSPRVKHKMFPQVALWLQNIM